MKKKGFTLIELLAVIVILAIVAMIATPIILGIIKKAEISAFKLNVEEMVNDAEKQFVLENIKQEKENIIFSNIENEQNAILLENNDSYKGYNYKIKLFTNKSNDTIGYFVIDNGKYSASGKIPIDKVIIDDDFRSAYLAFITDEGIIWADMDQKFFATLSCDERVTKKGYITYEDFYAMGTGKDNDAMAIYYAHKCANEKGIEVIANKNRTYYISSLPKDETGNDLSIEIKTNVDWNNSTIIIDDTVIDDTGATLRKAEVFIVPATRYLIMSRNIGNFTYNSETTDFSQILKPIQSNIKEEYDYYIGLDSTDLINRINNSTGQVMGSSTKVDYFKVDSNGKISDSNNLLYEYKYDNGQTNIKNNGQIKVFEIPNETLSLKNINFITKSSDFLACKASGNTSNKCSVKGGLKINRPNVEIDNLNHYIIDNDKPMYYSNGFLTIQTTSDITIKNSNFRVHLSKSSDGKEGMDGTYDIGMGYSSNITFENVGYTCNEGETTQECYEINMLDENYRGLTGTSDIKNWKIVNSKLNRIDSHFSLLNLDISNSIIGLHSINVTGKGNLNLNNSSVDQANIMINLRQDYGSVWNGNVNIDNVYFNIKTGDTSPRILYYNVTSTFDFNYDLYVPSISASDIFVNNIPSNSTGLFLVQGGAKTLLSDANFDEKKRPTLKGDMTYTNIQSQTSDLLKIRYPLLGNTSNTNYCYPHQNGEAICIYDYGKTPVWGVERAHIGYYKNELPINVTLDTSGLSTQWTKNFYEDAYCGSVSLENGVYMCKDRTSGKNAIEITTNNEPHPYCKIETTGTSKDGWYTKDVTVKLSLKITDGSLSDYNYGLSYDASKYEKTQSMTIPSSKKGAFNVYGYIEDKNGNRYDCIKLIKRA